MYTQPSGTLSLSRRRTDWPLDPSGRITRTWWFRICAIPSDRPEISECGGLRSTHPETWSPMLLQMTIVQVGENDREKVNTCSVSIWAQILPQSSNLFIFKPRWLIDNNKLTAKTSISTFRVVTQAKEMLNRNKKWMGMWFLDLGPADVPQQNQHHHPQLSISENSWPSFFSRVHGKDVT